MGTKRQLAGAVRQIVDDAAPRGRVVDLFAGMGSVAASLAPRWHVTTNDALSFTAVFSRARFLPSKLFSVPNVLKRLSAPYQEARAALRSRFADRLEEEKLAIGSQKRLRAYMAQFAHVGNSPDLATEAKKAARCKGISRYQLLGLYFAGGYFSLQQALDFDALRFAIDTQASQHERDRALGAWIWAASLVINAPGHTAQFLKPNSKNATTRVRACWRRNAWDTFSNALADLRPQGTAAWRASNRVTVGDALHFLATAEADAKLVYADPPYTKDQYSRYYHLYETMFRYDYPDSHGIGRYRSDRFVTDFSKASAVDGALQKLASCVAERKATLVLSYPSNGLLHRSGGDIKAILSAAFDRVSVKHFAAQHSTMGASSGDNVKPATENLYVCE